MDKSKVKDISFDTEIQISSTKVNSLKANTLIY